MMIHGIYQMTPRQFRKAIDPLRVPIPQHRILAYLDHPPPLILNSKGDL